jgi:hypothetical protein
MQIIGAKHMAGQHLVIEKNARKTTLSLQSPLDSIARGADWIQFHHWYRFVGFVLGGGFEL